MSQPQSEGGSLLGRFGKKSAPGFCWALWKKQGEKREKLLTHTQTHTNEMHCLVTHPETGTQMQPQGWLNPLT